MNELVITGIASFVAGFAIGVAVYDYARRRIEEKNDPSPYPKCTCHDPQYCDIHCIGKENFYRYHP